MQKVLRVLVVLVGLVGGIVAVAAPASAAVLPVDLALRIEPGPGIPPQPGGEGSTVVVVENRSLFSGPAAFGVGVAVVFTRADGSFVQPKLTYTCDAPATMTCPDQYRPLAPDEFDEAGAVTGTFPVSGQLRMEYHYDIPEDVVVTVIAFAQLVWPAGVQDQDPSNDATPWLFQPFEMTADLGVTLDNGRDAFVPGVPTTYTAEVTNGGPDPVAGVVVQSPSTPPDTTWTCVPVPPSTCAPSGSGSLDTTADLAAGGRVTYTITFSPEGIPPGFVDFLYGVGVHAPVVDEVVAIPVPDGSTQDAHLVFTTQDPVPANNLATDYDFQPAQPGQADVGITIDNGVDVLGTGEEVTYTFVVTNDGPEATSGSAGFIMAPFELGSLAYTCTPTGGASCTPSGVGSQPVPNLQVVGDTALSLPAGSAATYRVTGVVTSELPRTTINAVFTPASVPLGGNRTDDFVIDSDPIIPGADLAVTLTDQATSILPGAPTTYQLVVTNSGPDTATGVRVDHELPAGIEGATWTCTATPGATCSASGPGGVQQRLLTIPAGGSLTFTITGTVAATAAGTLTSTATVDTPETLLPDHLGIADPVESNDSATDTTAVISADLGVSIAMPVGTVPGATVPIELTVTNGGTAPAADAALQLPVPAGTTFVSAQQTSGPVASLTTPAVGGTGTVDATWATLAPGASATFTVRVAVGSGVPIGTSITATATVSTTSPEAADLPNTASASTLVVPTVTATVARTSLRVTEGSTAAVTVRFSQPTALPTTVAWTAVDGIDNPKLTARGAQLPIADYVAGPASLVVPAGTTSVTITVPTNVDAVDEADESFRIQLTASDTPGLVIGTPSTTTVTILANRSGTPPPPPPPFPPTLLGGGAGR